MTREQQCVLAFHKAVDHYWQPTPSATLPLGERKLRTDVLLEEVTELLDAMTSKDIAAIAKELADVLYVVYGCGLAYGLDLEAVFMAVHRSNMTKAHAPKDAMGKVTKGPHYQPPDMAALIQMLQERSIA